MSQWLKTATNGNVDCVFALLTNRMKLECNKCDMTLTVPIPDDPTVVDYSVSEFVKIHSHQGGHTGFEPHSIDKKAQELAQKMAEITGGTKLDKDPDKAAKIEQFAKTYAEQLKKKLDDSVIAAKIKVLQTEGSDPAKLANTIGQLNSLSTLNASLKPEIVAELVNQAYEEGVSKNKSNTWKAAPKPKPVVDEDEADDDDYFDITTGQTVKKATGARAFHGSDGVGGVIVDGKKIYWVKDEKGNVVGVSDHPPLVPVPVKAKDNPLEQKGRKFR